jgi:hypothetical protein
MSNPAAVHPRPVGEEARSGRIVLRTPLNTLRGIQSRPSVSRTAQKRIDRALGSREKNKITFYPSRLQAIFARSGGGKNLKRACYSSGFANPGANEANPYPGAKNVIFFFRGSVGF